MNITIPSRPLRHLTSAQNIAEEVEEAEDVDARAAVLASHPRLPALTARYGEVATSGGGGGSGARGRTMASTMVDLKLTCVAVAAGAKMGTQVKKLPLSTTLGALRLLCDKLFKVRVGRQAVFLRSPGDPLPEELGVDEDGRTLQALGVQVRGAGGGGMGELGIGGCTYAGGICRGGRGGGQGEGDAFEVGAGHGRGGGEAAEQQVGMVLEVWYWLTCDGHWGVRLCKPCLIYQPKSVFVSTQHAQHTQHAHPCHVLHRAAHHSSLITRPPPTPPHYPHHPGR